MWCIPTFLQEKFLALPFFKKVAKNPLHKLTSTPTSLFLLAQKAQKKKLCKKKTPFLWGVAPNPIRFLEKAKPKTFTLGHSDIRFEASSPDGVIKKRSTENTSRSSVLFLKTPKNLSARKFFAELFFKKAT